MPLNWMDVSDVSFNALLLLERVQLSWFPNWNFPEPQMSQALAANPAVAWYLRHKAPEIAPWVDAELATAAALAGKNPLLSPEEIRQAEVAVLRSMVDLLVYALDPLIYDAQPFLAWDSGELTGCVDFGGKTVLDIGSGTGRLAFVAAPLAKVVFPVEPVANLRDYLRQKAARLGFANVYPVDGTITSIPFPDGFADVVMSGHVYGDEPEAELREMMRVTRLGGMVILCPGSNDVEEPAQQYLVEQGFEWSRFYEPEDGWKRKFWKTVTEPGSV